MTSKRELPSERQNPLEFLNGRNYVLADTFLIQNGSPEETLMANAQRFLSDQGLTDGLAFTFYNSEREQIGTIVNFLKTQKKALSASNDPWMGIAGFNAKQLQRMSEVISQMIREKNPIMEGIDTKNIIILQVNTTSHMNPITDARTGLTLATLKRGETAFLTHPTPNS